MKLLYCEVCGDVVRLISKHWRKCECGKSGGQYNKDDMTATISGLFARVFGIGNPFFLPEYPAFKSSRSRIRFIRKFGYGPTDCWWGDYPGERQLFHIKSPNGPRLRVKIIELATGTNLVEITDKRSYRIDFRADIKEVLVPANPKPSFKGK
jgi:hypothetical protein